MWRLKRLKWPKELPSSCLDGAECIGALAELRACSSSTWQRGGCFSLESLRTATASGNPRECTRSFARQEWISRTSWNNHITIEWSTSTCMSSYDMEDGLWKAGRRPLSTMESNCESGGRANISYSKDQDRSWRRSQSTLAQRVSTPTLSNASARDPEAL